VSIGGDWRYTSFYYNNVSNDPLLAQSKAVGVVQGFVKWTSTDDRWNVAVEGRNLADKMYYRSTLLLSSAVQVNVRVGFNF
jgi:outer membrane receptor for ferric coprogen and ferric-rhodotorulic acid